MFDSVNSYFIPESDGPTEGDDVILGEKYDFLTPYLHHIGEDYRNGLMEAVMMCQEIGESIGLSPEDRDTIELVTLLSDIGKFGNQIFREESNQALNWLYSFDTTLKSEAKKSTSLTDFLLPNNPEDAHGANLERWLIGKGISFESADIRSHFDSLHDEEIFRDYATEYTIDYKSISLGQAWSIYHVLSAESIWSDLHNQGLITSKSIDIARLHHLREGVHSKRVRDIFLDDESSETNAKLLSIMIIVDKVQAMRQRISTITDSERREYISNLTPDVRINLGPKVVQAYTDNLSTILDTYLQRTTPYDRRQSENVIASIGAGVAGLVSDIDNRAMNRRSV